MISKDDQKLMDEIIEGFKRARELRERHNERIESIRAQIGQQARDRAMSEHRAAIRHDDSLKGE